jgi:hypothetical protein
LVDWSPVGAAVGTVGAFGVSLYLLMQQRNDRREDVAERRKEQARLVVAWPGRVRTPPPDLAFEFVTRNGSPEPVYDVSLYMPFGRSGAWVEGFQQLPPESTQRTWIAVPGATGASPSVDIAFRDTAGRRWLRTFTGELRETSDEEVRERFTPNYGAYASPAEHPTWNIRLDEEGNRVPVG